MVCGDTYRHRMGRGLTPDNATEIALSGCARRHALDGAQCTEAIEELRLIPSNRSDLLAEPCGLVLRGYLALVSSQDPGLLHAAALLAEAGADPRLVAGRGTTRGNHHATGGIGGPRTPRPSTAARGRSHPLADVRRQVTATASRLEPEHSGFLAA